MTTASSRYSARISCSASEVHLRLQVAGWLFEVLGHRPRAASSSWRRTASRMRRLPRRRSPTARRTGQPRLRVLEQPVDDLHDALDTVLCVALARRSWNSASSSAPEWPFATRSSCRRMTSSSRRRSSALRGRRPPAHLRLEEEPRVHELLAKRAMPLSTLAIGATMLDRDLPDVVAPAVTALDQTRYLELAYGLPYHGAAHLNCSASFRSEGNAWPGLSSPLVMRSRIRAATSS